MTEACRSGTPKRSIDMDNNSTRKSCWLFYCKYKKKKNISGALMPQFKNSNKTVNTVLKKTVLKKTVFRTVSAVHFPCPFNLLCRFMPTMECSGEHNYLEEHLKISKKECICSQILATLASMWRGNVGICKASSTKNVRFDLS